MHGQEINHALTTSTHVNAVRGKPSISRDHCKGKKHIIFLRGQAVGDKRHCCFGVQL